MDVRFYLLYIDTLFRKYIIYYSYYAVIFSSVKF